MRIAQVLHDKIHWIFEDDVMPNLPPDPDGNPITLVDITEKPEVVEGWGYNAEIMEFIEPAHEEPIERLPTIEEEILFETKYQTMLIEMGGMM